MMTIASMRVFARGRITCSRCDDSLIVPERSEYLSKEQLVFNHWFCASCGNRFETEVLISSISAKAHQATTMDMLARYKKNSIPSAIVS
jgi:transposase-like protein